MYIYLYFTYGQYYIHIAMLECSINALVPQCQAHQDNRPLPVTSTGLLDGPSVDARLAWRQEMDRQVKRLLQDRRVQ